MVCLWRWLYAALLVALHASCEVLWTPILPASQDQVDLWTVSGRGCACPAGVGDPAALDCACCVNRIACPCGSANLHRCAQCGLHQHCNKMCNVTIDGALLSVTSGRMSGSLVPPGDMTLPLTCWYILRAPPGHRVEIQLHRLVHIGTSFNTTTCGRGYVEVSDGRNVGGRGVHGVRLQGGGGGEGGLNTMRICGEDQRLHPPAILYSDSGSAAITYHVSEQRGSPRFIAYYNFPHRSHPVTGDRQRGGSQVEYTACDWLYQDVHCMRKDYCHFTSPGYPGMYPPSARCRYLMVMSTPSTSGTITFLTMDLPPERCATDYLSIHAGTSTSSPLITTLCGTDAGTIHFRGPNVLVDFSTGIFLPPYKFSGFHATVMFTNVAGGGLPLPNTSPAPPSHLHIMSDPGGGVNGAVGCHRVYFSNGTRHGNFDTSTFTPASRHCWLRFVGQRDEVIQVSLFKYKLGGKSCSSEASIYDGVASGESDSLLRQICGPVSREPRDSKGKFLQPEFFISSGNVMEVHLRLAPDTDIENQFLVGAFQFHNSRLEGTKKPNSVCDVMFYGADSPARGTVQNPPTPLLWNIEGALTCSYLFVPTTNQSLSLMVRRAAGLVTEEHCITSCGDEGCRCRPSMMPLSHVDHLLFVQTNTQKIIACICSAVNDTNPVALIASGGVDVTYHVSHFTWATPGFNFTLDYSFPAPTTCGSRYYKTKHGEMVPRQYTVPTSTHLYVTCHWVITRHANTTLTLAVKPPRQGSCNTWNLTVEGVSRKDSEAQLMGGACGADSVQVFHLSPHREALAITLVLGGRGMRDWQVTWNSLWPEILPEAPATSVSPKPEQSRTLYTKPTGRTFTVRSDASSVTRASSTRSWRLLHCMILLYALTRTHWLPFRTPLG